MKKKLNVSGKKRMKLTPQRMAIFDYLDGNTSHPSANDVYKAVIERFPTMSFATVYNTMDMLKTKGMVLELSIDPDKKRFDPNPVPHHHLICVHCKKIVDVHRDFSLDLSEEERGDYEIIGNHVDFYGVCKTCSKKDRKEEREK